MDKLLTTNEVGEILGCSRQWVAHLLRAGELEGRKLGPNWVVSQESVERYLRKQKEESDDSPGDAG
jgi:excisionase family DNA binding protein